MIIRLVTFSLLLLLISFIHVHLMGLLFFGITMTDPFFANSKWVSQSTRWSNTP